jgi:hypothetical protein
MADPATAEPVRTGRCLCGAVRFETRGSPRFVSVCHCESCRRAHSAPAVAWAGFNDEHVSFTGAPAAFASSPGVTRLFCAQCGSPLAFRGERWAGETHLPVAAFDEPAALGPPKEDFYVQEKLAWTPLFAAKT